MPFCYSDFATRKFCNSIAYILSEKKGITFHIFLNDFNARGEGDYLYHSENHIFGNDSQFLLVL